MTIYKEECVKANPEYKQPENVKSKNGFEVVWYTALGTETIPEGIYIRFFRPDGQQKEETFFPFGQETAAREKFNSHVNKLKEWGELE
jgi:hypothetical protein